MNKERKNSMKDQFEKYLPLGSVVLLKETKKEL